MSDARNSTRFLLQFYTFGCRCGIIMQCKSLDAGPVWKHMLNVFGEPF